MAHSCVVDAQGDTYLTHSVELTGLVAGLVMNAWSEDMVELAVWWMHREIRIAPILLN